MKLKCGASRNDRQAYLMLKQFILYKRFGRFRRWFDRRVPAPRTALPRLIHIYWEQGFDKAPDIVARSVASWTAMNPDWEVKLWTGRPFGEFVVPTDMTITSYSNLVRWKLLREEGGVWADATTVCRVPLNDWLPMVMSHCDFFAFSKPGPDRPLASWFLAARPGNFIVIQMLAVARKFWRNQNRMTRVYHWTHYTFDWLLRTSPAFARAWAETPQISAAPSFPTWQGEPLAWVLKFSHKNGGTSSSARL